MEYRILNDAPVLCALIADRQPQGLVHLLSLLGTIILRSGFG